jgi:hypothetical protein
MIKVEPKPPYCSCCEYMHHCIGDSQKPDYCPDGKYQQWLQEQGFLNQVEDLK